MGQDPGLARAGAGEDQQRPLAVLHGIGLRRIEAREQALDRRRTGADRRSGALAEVLQGRS